MDFDLVLRAGAYAAELHRDDVRKGTTIPYLSHLWSVAALVLEHGGDDRQVAAALLHDAVEDHGGVRRLAEIRSEFGDDIAAMVEALSDSMVDTTAGERKLPWIERKHAYLSHLDESDGPELLVSACDKLHNARSMLADYREVRGDLWERFTMHDPASHVWYYRTLVAVLDRHVPTPLGDELRRTVETLVELVSEDVPDLDQQVEAFATQLSAPP